MLPPNLNNANGALLPPTLISACAGAGKTHRLTNRIIGLLLLGETPSKILALTFSRKAAGEIRSRVLDRLTRGASSRDETRKLAGEIGIDGITTNSINTAISALTNGKHQIRFQTFDSFFIEMVRCFPAQVGLSRNVAIADNGSLRALEQQAFDMFLESRSTKQIKDFEAAFTNLADASATGSLMPHTKYKSWIAAEFGPLVASPQHEWWIPNAIAEIGEGHLSSTPFNSSPFNSSLVNSSPVNESLLNDSLSRLNFWTDGSSITAIPPKKDGSPAPRARWKNTLEKIKAAIEQHDLQTLLDSTFLQAISSDKGQYDKADIPPSFYAAWGPLSRFIKESIIRSIAERVSQIRPFLEEFDNFLQTAKRKNQLMSFTDCKRALLTIDIRGAAEDVYFRLDSQISHILLDEFQDTSPLEWQILRPLAEEILSKSDGLEKTFFCVGDSKQAIYGWRGGQAELLAALGKRYQDYILNISENTTRRCSKNIVHSINTFFQALDHNPDLKKVSKTGAAFAKEFKPHHALEAASDGLFYLEALDLNALKLSPAEQRLQVYQRAAILINDLYLKCPWARIGVLFTQNQGIAQMKAILSSPPYDLAVSEEGKRPIERYDSVSAILGLLHLIDHPLDSIESFRLASSPLGDLLGFTDHQNTQSLLNILRNLKDELTLKGIDSFISDLISRILPKCNVSEVSQLLKLEELAISSQMRGITRSKEIIEFINAAMSEDPSESRIRLLTIHGSKGLEFDIVVLPDLDQDLTARFRRSKLLFSGKPDAPTQISINPSQAFCQFVPELSNFRNAAFDSFIHEALCCLYVALTRARYANYVFCTSSEPPAQGVSLSSIIRSGPYQPTSDFTSFDSSQSCGYAVGELNWWQPVTNSHDHSAHPDDRSLTSWDYKDRIVIPDSRLVRPKIGRRFFDRHSPSDPITRYSSANNSLSISELPGILTHTSEGSLIHQALSQLEWLDPQNPPPPEILEKFLLPETINQVFLLEKYQQSWPNAQVKLYREQPIAAIVTDEELTYYNEAPTRPRPKSSNSSLVSSTPKLSSDANCKLITGTIDRLIIIEDAVKGVVSAEIIDFKTDKISENRLDETIQHYTPQLNLYRLALSKSHQIDPELISLKLAFLRLNKVCVVH